MKTKKMLSIILALMMLMSVVPLNASAAVELSQSNVARWPTTSGEIYFGQKLSDGITLNAENALVTSDGTETGTVIPGKWEFVDKYFAPTAWSTATKADIKFTPDNTDEYQGFEVLKSANVTYVVNRTTPVFVDETNDPIVATDVEQGSKLSTSIVSGGQMKNPYTGDIINKAWKWSSKNTIVNSSGEYKANFAGGSSYNKVEAMVHVNVIGSMKETEIIIPDTPITVEYSPSVTFGSLSTGSLKAVEKGTSNEVEGTFSIKSPETRLIGVGTHNVSVEFTPEDSEKYIASEGTMQVVATTAEYKFLTDDNEVGIPEIVLPYGTTFNVHGTLGTTLKSRIKDREFLTTGKDVPILHFADHDAEEIIPVGTYTYNVNIRPYSANNPNYASTNLQFKLTIEPVVFTTTAYWSHTGDLSGKVGYVVPGTFDIYVDGELIAENIKITRIGNDSYWKTNYPVPATGDYRIKVVYNPAENDPYSMEDYETTVSAQIRRYITYVNTVGHKINGDPNTDLALPGATIDLSIVEPGTFIGWKITDKDGNRKEAELEIEDIMASEISFTMPDYDIIVEAEYQKSNTGSDNNGSLLGDIDLGDLTQGDSDSKLTNFLNNIIALFKNAISKLTEFFRSIGNRT